MADIAIAPFIMRDCLFQVAADNYEGHVSQVEFVPSPVLASWKGLKAGAVHQFAGLATWVANLALAQDWETADSLARYLHEHEGEEVTVTFEPVKGGPGVTATLILVPGSIGGQVDSVAVSAVSCPVNGKPAVTAIV
ncbi:hypothetical protein ACTU6V_05390 [Microbacterium sp. A204]|uniref:hypothetical protein n=1 Tax=Microbacterium sp. A204 TaxID=3457321 RepID=UPI003FD1D11E